MNLDKLLENMPDDLSEKDVNRLIFVFKRQKRKLRQERSLKLKSKSVK